MLPSVFLQPTAFISVTYSLLIGRLPPLDPVLPMLPPLAQDMSLLPIDGVPVPSSSGSLEAFISPPNPNEETLRPGVYVWDSIGPEKRRAIPRGNVLLGTAGWKEIDHTAHLWVIWFGEETDPDADTAFPSVIDTITKVLRGSANPAEVNDPLTGDLSLLIDVGERINYDYPPVRAVADQRYLRYDAQFSLPILELFQA